MTEAQKYWFGVLGRGTVVPLQAKSLKGAQKAASNRITGVDLCVYKGSSADSLTLVSIKDYDSGCFLRRRWRS